MPAQLPLALRLRPALGRGDFRVTASNAEACAFVDRWPDWPGRALLLTGAPGSGKSHLALVWRRASGAAQVAAHELTPDRAPALAASGAVVEDADRDSAGLPPPAERALLHLLNLAAEDARVSGQGPGLLLAARTPPAAWPLRLPDLASRLRALPQVRLEAPDDALLQAVLMKLFADRQLAVSAAVVDYMAMRIERSLKAAAHAVDAVDRASLSGRRPVTVPLVRAVLCAMPAAAPGDGA